MKKILTVVILVLVQFSYADIQRGIENYQKFLSGEIKLNQLSAEEINELMTVHRIMSGSSINDSTNVSDACYDGYRKCKSNCSSSIYDYESGQYLWNTDASSKCEDACSRGKRYCEDEDDRDDACYEFKRKCANECSSDIYDYESGQYLWNTDASSKCEDACSSGKRYCE